LKETEIVWEARGPGVTNEKGGELNAAVAVRADPPTCRLPVEWLPLTIAISFSLDVCLGMRSDESRVVLEVN
jgi:hypothetical protein